MTPRERVILALEHRAPDIAPYQLDMTGAVYKKLTDHYGREDGGFHRSVTLFPERVPANGRDIAICRYAY